MNVHPSLKEDYFLPYGIVCKRNSSQKMEEFLSMIEKILSKLWKCFQNKINYSKIRLDWNKGEMAMRMVDLIEYKKNNGEFNQQQIQFIIDGYVDGSIPDYQMSALLMAICFQGLTAKETAMLTQAMEYSGDIIDLSKIEGVKADKHSTGGVGDKTSLVLGPIVAASNKSMILV